MKTNFKKSKFKKKKILALKNKEVELKDGKKD
jgi:hypothetical protein